MTCVFCRLPGRSSETDAVFSGSVWVCWTLACWKARPASTAEDLWCPLLPLNAFFGFSPQLNVAHVELPFALLILHFVHTVHLPLLTRACPLASSSSRTKAWDAETVGTCTSTAAGGGTSPV